MWELDQKEGWAPKNWCFPPMVLEKTLGSPLDCKEIKPVNPKQNQSWMFIGRTDIEAEAPILDVKNWLIWKNPDAGMRVWGTNRSLRAETVSQGVYKACMTFANTQWLHVKYSRTRRLLTSLSWTIVKAECQRIDVFELWCWRRLLGVPWTARRSNQSILKEICPDYSLEGLMLKL